MTNQADPQRPQPDSLLRHIQEEEKRSRRGKLKIFFGSCAGVGKTYAMLSAAHEKRDEGVDIVAGIIETHGRPETEKLLQGLPALETLTLLYRSVNLRELDLDAALKRKPAILLVDEFAHTNAPGMRHPKRWNDVEELLDAGIDVYTTLNVQHIESLSDLIAGTTGIVVKETIPDSVFDDAADIILVDINADDLLKRLSEGKVYIAERARANAADNFFKKNNLIALRELALRRTAERIDAQREEQGLTNEERNQIPIADKILVCIGSDVLSAKLVRTAKRMAASMKAPWFALYIENPRHYRLSKQGLSSLRAIFRLTENMGGKVVTVQGDNAADQIIDYAHAHRVTKIIIGRPLKPAWRIFVEGTLSDSLIRKSGNIDVYVITGEGGNVGPHYGSSSLHKAKWNLYGAASFAVVLATSIGILARDFINASDEALIYLTGVVAVASRYGMGPALFYAFLSAACLDFFFIAPTYSFSIYDRSYWATLFVLLVTGSVIANQASRLRLQNIMSRRREQNTQALYALTKRLASLHDDTDIAAAAASQIGDALAVDVTIWVPRQHNNLESVYGKLPNENHAKEHSALLWCFDNKKPAGRATDTMPSARALYLPLLLADGAAGVLGVVPRQADTVFSVEENALLETTASLLAASLERANAAELAERSIIEAESERLRNTLLSSVSHDLRTPLASITGASSSIAMDAETMPRATIHELAKSIQGEASRLSRIVTNLLDVTTLESGQVKLNQQPYFIQEIIGSALARLEPLLTGRALQTHATDNLPMAMVDGTLIEQVLQNLIENAVHHTTPQTAITVSAVLKGNEIMVTVSDNGGGIRAGEEEKIFDKFYTVTRGETHKGTGLGLAICAGIIRAHGGHIWVSNLPDSGAKFCFTLPLADQAKLGVPDDLNA